MDFTSSLTASAYLETLALPNEAPRINSLLDTPVETSAAIAEDQAALGAVVKDSVISYVKDLPPALRQAVMDSTLAAQLDADARFPDQQKDARQWYDRYMTTLAVSGFGTVSSRYQTYSPRSTEVELNSVVLEIIEAAAGPNKAALLSLAGNALEALKGDTQALNKMESKKHDSTVGGFQIMPALYAENGNAIVMLACMQIHRKESSGGFWFVKWKRSDVTIYRAADAVELNAEHYDMRAKGLIQDFLYASAGDYLSKLKMPENL